MAHVQFTFDAEKTRKLLDYHDHDSICLSLPACCSVGNGEVTRALLAEIERLMERIRRMES